MASWDAKNENMGTRATEGTGTRATEGMGARATEGYETRNPDSMATGTGTRAEGMGARATEGYETRNPDSMATGPASNTAGPHTSDTLNRVDPRVDSDRDNSKTLGSNVQTGRNVPEGTYGPHSSRAANAADPRVDSDRDRTSGLNKTHGRDDNLAGTAFGSGNTYGAGYGSGVPEGTHGPHHSRAANTADPLVDSDRDHRARHQQGEGVAGVTGVNTRSTMPGPAPNTAGPHRSDVLNKVDPRVDSNLDGSKTLGGNRTFE